MKEIEIKTRQQKVIVKEQKKGVKHLSSIRKVKGLKMYQCFEGVVKEAEVESFIAIGEDGLEKKNFRIKIQEGAKYIQSLNLKNAIRKFKKYE